MREGEEWQQYHLEFTKDWGQIKKETSWIFVKKKKGEREWVKFDRDNETFSRYFRTEDKKSDHEGEDSEEEEDEEITSAFSMTTLITIILSITIIAVGCIFVAILFKKTQVKKGPIPQIPLTETT